GLSLNPEDPENLERLVGVLGLQPAHQPRLLKALQGGIPHQVLNARKHDEESIIIARAGAFGAVTIATNMAGRGVDIKLGGELPEETIRDTNRVLGRTEKDPYDLTHEERRKALLAMSTADYGIYEESVSAFLKYMEDREQVRALGGLHVIGSERHEARRIDNQLRGRSARQGDPGSSRFYLSLEDELMRLFGGAQVENLWKRLMFDDSQPLEMDLLGRLVEQSQQRVEGANFDVRKHLLEYDDVLNTQRKRIYAQRDRVFEKEDLSEDVLDMLRTELQKRIPEALKDDEGPWRLLAYLEEVHPPFNFDDISHPSFTFRLLIDSLSRQVDGELLSKTKVRAALLELAERCLLAEREHLLRSATALLERTEKALETQREERFDLLDTYFDGLAGFDEEAQPPRPHEMLAELSELARIQIKLTSEQLRRLPEADPEVKSVLRQQIDDSLTGIALNRRVGGLEHRLEESLELKAGNLQAQSWVDLSNQILDAVENVFDQRAARLLGENGQIRRDLDPILDKLNGAPMTERHWMDLLLFMAQGSRIAFDTRTHRRSTRFYTRLNHVYLAAQLLTDAVPQHVTALVTTHLEEGLSHLEEARGRIEWNTLVQNEARLQQLDERRRRRLVETLGLERWEELASLPLSELNQDDRARISRVLGQFVQNEVYRDLLLHVISEQWVDYLTRVEALRISIGLEAYAQRDPLVQYKGKASEMFQQLLADIRMGVISRLFTYRLRREPVAAAGREPSAAEQPVAQQAGAPEQKTSGGRKKRRHRH
ncbi:MAG: hypothetical protein U1B80_01045, partial [Anaerolineaceae bacterium]|nr:hypothetical protein [Anaerolineaceae bacterium]